MFLIDFINSNKERKTSVLADFLHNLKFQPNSVSKFSTSVVLLMLIRIIYDFVTYFMKINPSKVRGLLVEVIYGTHKSKISSQ